MNVFYRIFILLLLLPGCAGSVSQEWFSKLNGNQKAQLAAVSPPAGPSLTSQTITLTGTGFQSPITVQIGGVTCSSPSVLSSTSVSCTAPALSAGVYDVQITDSSGNLSTLSSGFEYYVSQFEFVDANGANGLNQTSTAWGINPIPIVLNSKLYVAWAEPTTNTTGGYAATRGPLRVAVYNGNDASPSWQFVDNNALTGGPLSLVIYQGKLYVGYVYILNGGIHQFHVSVYNGNDAAPAWTSVDGIAGVLNCPSGQTCTASKDADTPALSLAVFNTKLYVAWSQANSGLGDYYAQTRVAVYSGNDSSPSWSFVDGGAVGGLNLNSAHDASGAKLVVVNNVLYTAWEETYETGEFAIYWYPEVAAYNGNDSSPQWQVVSGGSGNYAPSRNVFSTIFGASYWLPEFTYPLAVYSFGGNLYLAAATAYSGLPYLGVALVSYNPASGSWSNLAPCQSGKCSLSSLSASTSDTAPKFAAFNGSLYLAFVEQTARTSWDTDWFTFLATYTNTGSWIFPVGVGQGLNYQSTSVSASDEYSSVTAGGPSMIEFNNHLYLVWSESADGSSSQIHVKMAQ